MLSAHIGLAWEVSVAVISDFNVAPYRTALDGFVEMFTERGIRLKLSEFHLGEERGSSIVDRIESAPPDLLLTIGTAATDLAHEKIREIPCVFSMVLNPVSSGFVKSMNSSKNNLTGASMDVPYKIQFATLREIFPGIKKIGVLYGKETEEIVHRASQVAKRMGLKLVGVKVESEADVPTGLEELLGKIDVLWSVADSRVFTLQSIQFIILFTIQNGIPFVGISESFVEAGALLAFSCDYRDLGRQAGESALRILKGENPANIPIAVPRKVHIFLNLRTAQYIGVDFPQEFVSKAVKLYR